ncbi:ABC transporter ATP-binding protein [Demequina zhanjiangensis]|uniref:ABC transporter ATP-binding protein n=1 Tax=Demequina zhanjiangensis TaxID=3051659 RepID=A0ABT8G1I0_9MICO|nr:ABC transporter ATP-binding protein [Demequina sp. SYSU T00b26]MDN4472991.1 ABC transporter ATP-binding protein [Demequina sp. SYSU T00b26]
MGPGGGGRRLVRNEDEARREIAEAPRIPDLWKRIGALFVPYRGHLILTAVLVIAASGAAVIPPLIVQRVFDEALFPTDASGTVGSPDMGLLVELVAVMIGIFIAAAALGVWQTYVTSTVGNRVTGDLRVRLFTRLQSMELGFFTRTKTGIIQSRLQNDVGGVSNVLTTFVQTIVGNVVTVAASLVAMIVLDWRLTLLAVILMPALVVVQRRVGLIRQRIAARTQESLSEMTAITQETLSVSGILLSKTYNRQRFETARYSDENSNQVRLQVQQAMSGQWFFGLVSIVMSSVPAVVYLAAGWLIWSGSPDAAGGALSAGTIVAFTTLQARLLFPLMALMRVALEVQTSKALFARIFEYLDLAPAISDRPGAIDVADAPGPMGRIEFRDVGFRYPGSRADAAPTLSGVTFTAEPGTTHAFVGPSGAGKTTVVYLAARLHEATEGSVVFAGADVRDLTQESVVDRIGVVTQETYLFHDTIAANLRYARPDATDAELERACRAANIHDTILGFEDGYATIVGERGYRLSGGEKQRIAIARVLLKDPPVLLLDEATSALDTVSERVVQEALDNAAQGRTTLVVAHRLSTVADADVIHVVQGGRIVESGSHDDLVARAGVYAELAAAQRR